MLPVQILLTQFSLWECGLRGGGGCVWDEHFQFYQLILKVSMGGGKKKKSFSLRMKMCEEAQRHVRPSVNVTKPLMEL